MRSNGEASGDEEEDDVANGDEEEDDEASGDEEENGVATKRQGKKQM